MLGTMLSFALWLDPVRATADAGEGRTRVTRELSAAARAALTRFRLVGKHLITHAPNPSDVGVQDRLSRIHSTRDEHFLVQMVTESHDLFRYAVRVGLAVKDFRVTRAEAAGASPHFPNAVYPSLTPWVSVVATTGQPGVANVAAGKGWKARNRPLDEQTFVLAVGRRVMHEGQHQIPREVRVQRFFLRKTMGRQISLTLAPAGPDGTFRRLRVSRNGLVGWLEFGPDAGEILSFRADQERIQIGTTARRELSFEVINDGDHLGFRALSARDRPDEDLIIESTYLPAQINEEPCDQALGLAAE